MYLRRTDHADGADVSVGEGEEGHDDDVGGIRLQQHGGQVPVPRHRVADQEQGDETHPENISLNFIIFLSLFLQNASQNPGKLTF